MTNLRNREALAEAWFRAAQATTESPNRRGWGWLPELPPDPMHTAEVVCALAAAGLSCWRDDAVKALIRESVMRHPGGDVAYETPIDVAWRLRALRLFGANAESDADVRGCVDSLVEAQDAETGGWRLASDSGPVSVTATAVAVLALIDGGATLVVRRGLRFLADAILDDAEAAPPTFVAAYVTYVFAQPSVSVQLDRRGRRAARVALQMLLRKLPLARFGVEEESYQRGAVIAIWRHLSLHIALRAIATADPGSILNPAFRARFVELLEYQETRNGSVHLGGFRTSREGVVTSYATGQALEVMAVVRDQVATRVNPGTLFDLVCRAEGAHHTDPQLVLSVRNRNYYLNSTAALTVGLLLLLAGISISVTAVWAVQGMSKVASRILIVWGILLSETGGALYASARLTSIPRLRVLVLAGTIFTALLTGVPFFLV